MKRITATTLFTLLLVATTTPQAKDMNQRFATYGLGAKGCYHYLSAVEEGGQLLDFYNNYTLGYLSAFNLIVPANYDILGEHAMSDAFEWLIGYCKANPQELYVNALANLTEHYYDTRRNFTPTGEGWNAPGEVVKELRDSLQPATE